MTNVLQIICFPFHLQIRSFFPFNQIRNPLILRRLFMWTQNDKMVSEIQNIIKCGATVRHTLKVSESEASWNWEFKAFQIIVSFLQTRNCVPLIALIWTWKYRRDKHGLSVQQWILLFVLTDLWTSYPPILIKIQWLRFISLPWSTLSVPCPKYLTIRTFPESVSLVKNCLKTQHCLHNKIRWSRKGLVILSPFK